jgi:hypothetical protein
MKLTKNTIPQARNYQCEHCKGIKCHKDMQGDDICYECWDNQGNTSGMLKLKQEMLKQ